MTCKYLFTSKVITHALNGAKINPVYVRWYYHGNILFRKGFTRKWFSYTGTCLHLLGFRFTCAVTTNKRP
jgi:hypothetical protein